MALKSRLILDKPRLRQGQGQEEIKAKEIKAKLEKEA
jgi:hypothetical protein